MKIDDKKDEFVCPNCLTANNSYTNFCVKCGAPLSDLSVTGPYEHILADGFATREATTHPTNLTVVVGIWILNAPVIPALLISLFIAPLFSLFLLPLCFVALVLIIKTTRNYKKGSCIATSSKNKKSYKDISEDEQEDVPLSPLKLSSYYTLLFAICVAVSLYLHYPPEERTNGLKQRERNYYWGHAVMACEDISSWDILGRDKPGGEIQTIPQIVKVEEVDKSQWVKVYFPIEGSTELNCIVVKFNKKTKKIVDMYGSKEKLSE